MNSNQITLFEYGTLEVGNSYNKVVFKESHLEAFNQFDKELRDSYRGNNYFGFIYNGVKFSQYVGVLQVGDLTIEILPKADKNAVQSNDNNADERITWRRCLIDILQVVENLTIDVPTKADLVLKPNALLELYFEFFIKEVEYLLHRGLIKRYGQTEGNTKSLKGALVFSKHLTKNFIHKDRFYTRHTTYNTEHTIHQILWKAILLVKKLTKGKKLSGRIGALSLNFPEMEHIAIYESTFERLFYDRKNAHYTQSLEIAKLILLNYHPDLIKGENNVLAILFDMNKLWERFIAECIRGHGWEVKEQEGRNFWQYKKGGKVGMNADIVCSKGKETLVLDTKWKNISYSKPSSEDLRQMYVYHDYYNASKVVLVYPGNKGYERGHYFEKSPPCNKKISQKECGVLKVPVMGNIEEWMKEIKNLVFSIEK